MSKSGDLSEQLNTNCYLKFLLGYKHRNIKQTIISKLIFWRNHNIILMSHYNHTKQFPH